jgi:hypothetical protein
MSTSFLDLTWIFLAAIFFYFAYIYWRYSVSPIRPFVFRKRGEGGEVIETDPEPPAELSRDLQGFLDSVNSMNKIRYRVAAGGFFIAGVNAIAAMLLS